jgi:hypothetical protein
MAKRKALKILKWKDIALGGERMWMIIKVMPVIRGATGIILK